MVGYEDMLSIGDVCKFLDVPPHTIRYWEKEFRIFLFPARTQGNQRRFTDGDMEKIRTIKKLLKEDGYSIAGAKKILSLRQKQEMPEKAGHGITEEMANRIVDMVRSQFTSVASSY
ncbi:MAG: MerR family transcriptional regulator [Elusimicrobiota bacterium]